MMARQLRATRRRPVELRRQRFTRGLALLLCCAVVMAGMQPGLAATANEATSTTNANAAATAPQAASPVPATPQELDQLVAPIALYPDALVAQILAASTYPTEVVEADRWMQQHSSLKGDALAREVDKQPWDASVKALTQFPAVLSNMDQNLSWTSALGEAYANQPQDVMNEVQAMRQRAQSAGNLKNTSQQTVTTQGQSIVIQPADPSVVYVPQYDPWLVYGAPLVVYPGWAPFPGLYLAGPGFAFGLSFGIFAGFGFGWGWSHWGADWHSHTVVFDHHSYISRSRTFSHGGTFGRGGNFGHAGGFHGGNFGHAGGFHGGSSHGFAAPHYQTAMHSGAFSGFDHGGVARGNSFRGTQSLGGFHGGFHGGGFHGGGFHGGGGHHR